MDAAVSRIDHRTADLAVLADVKPAYEDAAAEEERPLLPRVETPAHPETHAPMITYVDTRLAEWALWKSGGRRIVGGISPFPAYNLAGRGGVRDAPPPSLNVITADDARSHEVDKCVCALNPLLRQAIEEFYLRLGTVDQARKRCQCSEKTLYRRIDEAHQLILGWLNDLAAGVEVKAWSGN